MDDWTEEDKERANEALAAAVLEVKQLRSLRAENERLRKALEKLADFPIDGEPGVVFRRKIDEILSGQESD